MTVLRRQRGSEAQQGFHGRVLGCEDGQVERSLEQAVAEVDLTLQPQQPDDVHQVFDGLQDGQVKYSTQKKAIISN
nr:hypothetical protein BaRGS_026464 [Batillaria attramentaria]